jgi:hypothetical protein
VDTRLIFICPPTGHLHFEADFEADLKALGCAPARR